MVHQSIMQKSILTKKRKDTVSTIRMASITREKTDGMTAFTKIIRKEKHSLESGGKKPFGTGKKIAVAFGCAAVFGLVLGVTFGTIDSKNP